jgi:hypothetical protein
VAGETNQDINQDRAGSYISQIGGYKAFVPQYLYQIPVITVNTAVKVTELSYAHANRLITKFQEYGILNRMDTYQRNRRFIYSEYLLLFDDDVMREIDSKTSLKGEQV